VGAFPFRELDQSFEHLISDVLKQVDQAVVDSFVVLSFQVIIFKNAMKRFDYHVGVNTEAFSVAICPPFFPSYPFVLKILEKFQAE
jgi:hypothetical protein